MCTAKNLLNTEEEEREKKTPKQTNQKKAPDPNRHLIPVQN